MAEPPLSELCAAAGRACRAMAAIPLPEDPAGEGRWLLQADRALVACRRAQAGLEAAEAARLTAAGLTPEELATIRAKLDQLVRIVEDVWRVVLAGARARKDAEILSPGRPADG